MSKTDLASLAVVLCVLCGQVLAVIRSCSSKRNPDLDNKFTESWLLSSQNSPSKLECASRCFLESSCVTFMFSSTSRSCRLHVSRISRNYLLVAAPGFRSYDTCRAADLTGAPCATKSDCKMSNTECINQGCQCDYAWSYSPKDLACVSECKTYGSEFIHFNYSYATKQANTKLTDPKLFTTSECASACVTLTSFTCRSFYLLATDSSCNLMEYTPPAGGLLSNLLGSVLMNVDFYQRQCM